MRLKHLLGHDLGLCFKKLAVLLSPPVVQIAVAVKLPALVVVSVCDFVCNHRADRPEVGRSPEVHVRSHSELSVHVKVDRFGGLVVKGRLQCKRPA